LRDASDTSLTPSATYISVDTTNIYLEKPRDADTRQALQLDSTARIKVTQKLSVTGSKIQTDVPHYLHVAWNRSVNSASGTLALHMGGQSASVAVSAQSGWQILRIAVGQNNWLRQVNENNLDIVIDWTPDSGGTGLLIDDVTFGPFTEIGGTWYFAEPGSTPFLYQDQWRWSDNVTSGQSDGVVQYWLWQGYGAYLPHSTSPSITDP
jgi:hypothetical protein